ncbi:MAG TPA: valine--tRNA ligase [Ktedonobacterales bacterium]|jgi:valyl-tRNA synthetase
MPLAKRYDPAGTEPQRQARWEQSGAYQYDRTSDAPRFAIDTPPPTVSGHLHLGHVYSYSHTDFLARYARMRGHNVFYPMGFDDNGLPTERLVEKTRGVRAPQIGRAAFIQQCLEVSEEAERDYRALWSRLGLSIDWRYTYRTIDERSRRTAQWSFIDLYRKGLAYRQEAPAIWCPECQTAIAQAELNDLERETTYYTLAFALEDGATLPIATTRPELLPACVAIFVHPEDERYRGLIGQSATTPLFGERVPILADERADPAKGSGAVMCCTFGDATDVEWWREYDLPLKVIIGRDGRLTEAAGDFAGMTTSEARAAIVESLEKAGKLLERKTTTQFVRVHERCDTPVEYVVATQWFVRALDFKAPLLAAGERIMWRPAHMGMRYREWVENLRWDWCISRQRYFGVPFPVWYCDSCGATVLANEDELPLDPTERQPSAPCACGGTSFSPERDVMDTWATSSLSPQIVGQYFDDQALYQRVFPFTLRPQAHEIIRTWAFYTILQSHHHFGALPWSNVAISGWGLAGEGMGKISKSRGGGPMAPLEMIERYSADAVRYWAASTGFGKDSIISEEKIATGAKLVTKLWNVAKFAERFLQGDPPTTAPDNPPPTDRWLLSRAQRLIARVTALFEAYDYAAAKSEIEAFFWRDLADNYLELAKARLYEASGPAHEAARYTLGAVLLDTLKLFTPFLPHVTDEIYTGLFAARAGSATIHRASWPAPDETLIDEESEEVGEVIVEIATAVRRHKSEANLSLGAELPGLTLTTNSESLAEALRASEADVRSVTRARKVIVTHTTDALESPLPSGRVSLALSEGEDVGVH